MWYLFYYFQCMTKYEVYYFISMKLKNLTYCRFNLFDGRLFQSNHNLEKFSFFIIFNSYISRCVICKVLTFFLYVKFLSQFACSSSMNTSISAITHTLTYIRQVTDKLLIDNYWKHYSFWCWIFKSNDSYTIVKQSNEETKCVSKTI